MTEQPLKAVLCARVSSEEQLKGYSIDAQRRAFQALVKGRGWIDAGTNTDEGKSTRTDNIKRRPAFSKMAADAMSGRFDVLVVHKLDRFSRNLRITLEYFDKLSRAGIAFVSINEQMDFSTPWGRLALTLLGGLAQFYSDNLSQETKKGWHERRQQGLHCGTLPFGATKGDDGVPIPDTVDRPVNGNGLVVRNFERLKMAFDLAAQGRSDREVAIALNAAGYRTTGTHGARPFSRDTVKDLVTNRFYVGEISNGNGGWIKAKHQSFVDQAVFEKAQRMREKNRTSTHEHTTVAKTVCSLTGITFCWHCREKGREGRLHIACSSGGVQRLGCFNRRKGWDCQQKSAPLSSLEGQIRSYLESFSIPMDYQRRILDIQKKLQDNYDAPRERQQLQARLDRVKELCSWGDITKEKYLAEKRQIQGDMAKLAPFEAAGDNLKRLAGFLGSVVKAWDVASPEHRNALARCLFQEIWVKDGEVVAVKPQPDYEPFFKLNWEEQSKIMKWRPRGDLNP